MTADLQSDSNTDPAALLRTGLFQGVSDAAIAHVLSIATEQTFAEGTTVFREGDPGNELHLILSGRIRISRNLAGMGEEALAVLEPGDAFGEMALIDDTPRSADAHVQASCKLLTIQRQPFEDLLQRHKELAYELLWNFVKLLSGRLRDTNDKMTFLSITGKF